MLVEQYSFVELQTPSEGYVDRNPDPNGLLYASIDTGGSRDVGAILKEFVALNDKEHGPLLNEALHFYQEGMFDDKYDNIARVAPELQEKRASFINRLLILV